MVLASHCGALLIAWLLALPTPASLALTVVIGASLGWQWRRGVFATPGDWRLADDGTCRAIGGEIPLARYRVVQASRYPGSVYLRLEDAARRRRALLIARDSVEAEIFRELCARIVQHRLPVRDRLIDGQ